MDNRPLDPPRLRIERRPGVAGRPPRPAETGQVVAPEQATHLTFGGLERLPDVVSGSLMGLLTGSVATIITSFEPDLWWTAGTGPGTAVIGYLLFHRLN